MDEIRTLVASGVLRPGDKLPSIREVAVSLRINPASVVKAYNELKHQGLLDVDHGRGAFVRATGDVVNQSRQELIAREVRALVSKARTLGFSGQELLKFFQQALKEIP